MVTDVNYRGHLTYMRRVAGCNFYLWAKVTVFDSFDNPRHLIALPSDITAWGKQIGFIV